ncbi:hypothetical protein BRD01_11785 [Halobacteriales archaeon QS_8_65_32]|nr:MAG: hypothetical protein BRD01_11785 [Halobacteriales archaeon QS_8_65_32]
MCLADDDPIPSVRRSACRRNLTEQSASSRASPKTQSRSMTGDPAVGARVTSERQGTIGQRWTIGRRRADYSVDRRGR